MFLRSQVPVYGGSEGQLLGTSLVHSSNLSECQLEKNPLNTIAFQRLLKQPESGAFLSQKAQGMRYHEQVEER